MPDPRLLSYFVAVADSGSVSAAARVVHVAQPSLSRQLRTLEATVGVDLFRRDGGPLQLTAAGRRFLPIARDLLHRHQIAVDTTRFLEGQGGLVLNVAATPTTIVDVIAPFIAEVDLGDVTLEAHEAVPEIAYTAITGGEADIAMTNEPPPPDLASFLVGRYPVFAYVSSEHPWANRSSITLEELAEQSLITSPASGTRRVIASLEALGLSFRRAREVPIPQVAQALAAAGKGVAVLSDDPRFDLRPLTITGPDGLITVAMYTSWDTSHYAANIIQTCAQRLESYCVENWPPLERAQARGPGLVLGHRREPGR